jgi:non-ribosomal peptide synthetase component F
MGLRLDDAEVDSATLSAWSTHLGRPVHDPGVLRRRLAEGTLPRVFQATAERMGSKCALTLPEGSITHAELDLSAGRMARELARLGAGPEAAVLIVADTSLRSLVAYLGALRTHLYRGGTGQPWQRIGRLDCRRQRGIPGASLDGEALHRRVGRSSSG